MEIELKLDAYGAQILKRCIDLYLERWPGGDPNEQQYLMQLQTTFHAIVLESTLDIDID